MKKSIKIFIITTIIVLICSFAFSRKEVYATPTTHFVGNIYAKVKSIDNNEIKCEEYLDYPTNAKTTEKVLECKLNEKTIFINGEYGEIEQKSKAIEKIKENSAVAIVLSKTKSVVNRVDDVEEPISFVVFNLKDNISIDSIPLLYLDKNQKTFTCEVINGSSYNINVKNIFSRTGEKVDIDNIKTLSAHPLIVSDSEYGDIGFIISWNNDDKIQDAILILDQGAIETSGEMDKEKEKDKVQEYDYNKNIYNKVDDKEEGKKDKNNSLLDGTTGYLIIGGLAVNAILSIVAIVLSIVTIKKRK